MSDSKTLLELADRVEAASGPDRELDAEIAVVALGMERDGTDLWLKGERYSIREPDYYDLAGHGCELPAYTASLDSAMLLVADDQITDVLLEAVEVLSKVGWPEGQYLARLRMFVCAAALRARAGAA